MSVRYLPKLDPERWYIIDIDRTDGAQPWRHRGLWLHGPNVEAHAEWNLLSRGFGLGVELGRNGSESDIGMSIYAGRLGSLWLRLRAPFTRWARVSKGRDPDRWYNPRHTSLRFFPHGGCIVSVEIDKDAHHWSKSDPWWKEIKLTTYQLLGKTHHETIDGDSGVTQIPLPEGVYDASWQEKINTSTYVGHRLGRLRDRVLGPRQRRWIDLTIEGGIPVEGKGENSYDCGMDGLFGCGGSSVEEAIGSAVSHVLRDRRRYGGPHNLPHAMTVSEAAQHPSSGDSGDRTT